VVDGTSGTVTVFTKNAYGTIHDHLRLIIIV